MLDSLVIEEKATIKDALRLLDKNNMQFLIVIGKNKYLKGTLTDGDIRRALLSNKTIQNSIDNIYNKKFEYLNILSSFGDVCDLFKSIKINFLPIIDINNKLVNIITKKQFHLLLLEDLAFDLEYDFSRLNNYILDHEVYERPWGFYKSTTISPYAQSKIITVFPKSRLSLQKHKKREEHWIVIKGKGKAIVGELIVDIYPGKYIYIPKECKHRIINDSNENVILTEVQLGSYFGEDDIIRHEDDYGRS